MRVTASSLTGLAALRFRVPLRAMPVVGHEDKVRLTNIREMYKELGHKVDSVRKSMYLGKNK